MQKGRAETDRRTDRRTDRQTEGAFPSASAADILISIARRDRNITRGSKKTDSDNLIHRCAGISRVAAHRAEMS